MLLFEKFGNFVMRGRKHAVILALLFMCIPFLFGSVLKLSGIDSVVTTNIIIFPAVVIIALITLHKGITEGAIVLLWAVIPYVVMGFVSAWPPFTDVILYGILFVWILALILRRYANWTLTLECAALMGAFAVVIIHMFIPHINLWWIKRITDNLHSFSIINNLNWPADRIQQIAKIFAHYMTGMQVVIISSICLVELILARHLQAKLYNPKSWHNEWNYLRLNFIAVIPLAACTILAEFRFGIFKDILPVLMLPFLIAGISLVHGYLVMRKASMFWFGLFYTLLIASIIISPIFLILLVIAAVIDSVINFRAKMAVRAEN